MRRKVREIPELENRHYFALLGLSEPTMYDEVVGSQVPFKLSEAAQEFIVEQSITNEHLEYAVEQAEKFFNNSYPNARSYFKNSRWSTVSPLRVKSISKELNTFGC